MTTWKSYKCGEKRYDLRFVYWKLDCGNGKQLFYRTTKLWWKPMMWLGTRQWFKYAFGPHYGKWTWWVRKYITYD